MADFEIVAPPKSSGATQSLARERDHYKQQAQAKHKALEEAERQAACDCISGTVYAGRCPKCGKLGAASHETLIDALKESQAAHHLAEDLQTVRKMLDCSDPDRAIPGAQQYIRKALTTFHQATSSEQGGA